jgi:hypothetical protein
MNFFLVLYGIVHLYVLSFIGYQIFTPYSQQMFNSAIGITAVLVCLNIYFSFNIIKAIGGALRMTG